MYKAKGSLNRQELSALDEVKIIQPEESQPEKKDKNKKKDKKRQNPYQKKRSDKHLVLLACALILIFSAAGFGLFSHSLDGGNIAVDDLTSINVTLNINSQPTAIQTNCTTVGQFLGEQQIRLTANDYIGLDMEQPLYDGMVIWLRLAITINVLADGETYSIVSQPITVREALSLAGVALANNDMVSLPLLQYVYEKTDIVVTRLWTQEEVVEESIEPPVLEQEFTYLAPGSSTMIYPGEAGIQESSYEVTYKDGKEIARVLQSSEVIKEPVEAVEGYGPSTVSVAAGLSEDGTTELLSATTASGATFFYTKSFTIETTAYTWTGNKTASGTWPKIGTIAVDPSVIPIGTSVYVVGYGFATAEDTGGAIQGNIIDLYMDTEEDCYTWGRRDVVIYILAE